MLGVLFVLVSLVTVWAETPCQTYSYAPVTTTLLAQSLSTSFVFPATEAHVAQLVGSVASALMNETQSSALLGFATPVARGKLLVRSRHCGVAEVNLATATDACTGRTDRIYEVYCPQFFVDEQVRAYTHQAGVLTSIGVVPLANPSIYNGGQNWFNLGLAGNTGFLAAASGMVEVNTTADVFVRPAFDMRSASKALVAVVVAVRSASEPCTPAINCVLGAWSTWGECSANCDGGYQTRSRKPLVPSQSGGTCDVLGEQRQCNVSPCENGLTDTARAGVILSCLAAIALSGLLFFWFASNKKVFTTKSKAQRKAAALAKQRQAAAQQRAAAAEAAAAARAAVAQGEEQTGEDDEQVVVGQPVKTVHIWV